MTPIDPGDPGAAEARAAPPPESAESTLSTLSRMIPRGLRIEMSAMLVDLLKQLGCGGHFDIIWVPF